MSSEIVFIFDIRKYCNVAYTIKSLLRVQRCDIIIEDNTRKENFHLNFSFYIISICKKKCFDVL